MGGGGAGGKSQELYLHPCVSLPWNGMTGASDLLCVVDCSAALCPFLQVRDWKGKACHVWNSLPHVGEYAGCQTALNAHFAGVAAFIGPDPSLLLLFLPLLCCPCTGGRRYVPSAGSLLLSHIADSVGRSPSASQ